MFPSNPSNGEIEMLRNDLHILVACLIIITLHPKLLTAQKADYPQGVIFVQFNREHMPDPRETFGIPPTLGQPAIDAILRNHEAIQIRKVMSNWGEFTSSPSGDYMDRLFLLYYNDGMDPAVISEELASLPHFDLAHPDYYLNLVYFGTHQHFPPEVEFNNQWNLHFDNIDDRVDIDGPEAWAIQRGIPDVIIGIVDTGTMIDTSGTGPSGAGPFGTHQDLSFLFTEEDNTPLGTLNWDDIDLQDALDPDIGSYFDNVIGYNFKSGYEGETDPRKAQFWKSMPVNWQLTDPSSGWNVSFYDVHGVSVAGIAAAIEGGGGIVGVASGSRIYAVGMNNRPLLSEAIAAVELAADFSTVINMSWGLCDGIGEEALETFKNALENIAVNRNKVLTAAAGNFRKDGSGTVEGCGSQTTVVVPARFEFVLGLGNMDSTLTLYEYSVYNPNEVGPVSAVAPVGRGIPASSHTQCDPGTHPCPITETVASFNGTSAAAPQAAGIAALLRTRFPSLNQEEVRERITGSAEWYWQATALDSSKYGHGKINAYRALSEWGSVTESTEWAASSTSSSPLASRDGVYYISGDLVVESGVSLTIAAGCTVRVAPDHEKNSTLGSDPDRVEIVIEGELTIDGTKANPVVFESFTDTGSSDNDWMGIRFAAGSTTDTLSGVVVRNAAIGIESAKPLTLIDCVIGQCSTAVKSSTDLVVQGSELRGISGYAIHATGGMVTLVADTLKGPKPSYGMTGVLLESGVTQANIEGCQIGYVGKGIDAAIDVRVENSSLVALNTGILSVADVDIVGSSIVFDLAGVTTTGSVMIDESSIAPSGNGTGGTGVSTPEGTVENSTISALVTAMDIGRGTLVGDTLTAGATGLRIGGPVTCRSSRISGEVDAFTGIDVSSSTDSLTLRQTEVTGFDTGVYVALGAWADIDSCTISNNDIGIEVYNSTQSAVRHSTLNANITDGVYCYNGSHITAEANTITNSSVGLYFLNSSDGVVQAENVIENNGEGIKCDDNSSPLIRSNKISGNTIGVSALNDANPDLGYGCSPTQCNVGGCLAEGGNKISANSSHHVVNLSLSVTVKAECNYWGPRGPVPGKFSGAVDYTPYMPGDPLPNLVSGGGLPDDDGEIEEQTESLPESYEISQNAPNPFNPTTVIRYQVPPPGGLVEIVIYSVKGQALRTLTSEPKAAGFYDLVWDGRDDRGQSVASGVYFVRMTAGRFVQTRKLLLLK
jgi:parallel beta-helix repeat protein